MKNKIKNWQIFILGLTIAFIFALICRFFSNPYPCQLSCIGCESIWESLSDNFVSIVSILGMIFGFILMFLSIFLCWFKN